MVDQHMSDHPSNELLRAVGLHKSFHNGKQPIPVLRDLNLVLHQGETLAVVGASGIGKSTLLHLLGTLDRPDAGALFYRQEDVLKYSDQRLARFRNQTMGFVFQFHHLLPEFTALENVCIPAFINKMKESDAMDRARELLDYLGLSERLSHKPTQLSGGEQQRVAVARSLMNSPAIVFADEPSGNLDSSSSQELHQLLFNLRKDFNQTFIIVTHNEELAQMSDRRLEMVDGQLME